MLKLGIIGLATKTNGHPFSYSSIINGYDSEKFPKDEWRGIYNYLERRHFSEMNIPNVKITHLWTQDKHISSSLAKACFIEKIVGDYENMIGEVDAVIIARDDEENHYKMAKPFLDAGIYLFIDKPLTVDMNNLKYFSNYLKSGKLMSCSGIRYCSELDDFRAKNSWGKINFITGTVMQDWEHYGIHLLEGIMGANAFKPLSVRAIRNNTLSVIITTDQEYNIVINTIGDSSFSFDLNYYCQDKNFSATITDNFTAFKRMLYSFIRLVQDGVEPYNARETIDLMKILIAAKLSIDNKEEIIIDSD